MSAGLRPVAESQRIEITDMLDEFMESDDMKLTFPANMNNHDRAVVHDECKRRGLISKSYGKGEDRAVTVSKPTEKKLKLSVPELDLPPDAMRAIRGLLGVSDAALGVGDLELDEADEDAPGGPAPDEGDLGGAGPERPGEPMEEERDGGGAPGGGLPPFAGALAAKRGRYDEGPLGGVAGDVGSARGGPGGGQRRRGEGGWGGRENGLTPAPEPAVDEEEDASGTPSSTASLPPSRPKTKFWGPEEVAARREAWRRAVLDAGARGAELEAARAALPVARRREEILAALRSHQVVFVAGETGSGKSTQIPQYVVEDAWARGKGAQVVVSQPRRLSAKSVAARVAEERSSQPGVDVGHSVRLDTRANPDTSVIFVTSGVLLRALTRDPGRLSALTHVVLDEVHERDLNTDVLLTLLRDALPAHPDLRVLLMSATLESDGLRTYFANVGPNASPQAISIDAPLLRVPGRTYPVEEFYLEDVLGLTGYRGPEGVRGVLGGERRAPGAAGCGLPSARDPTPPAELEAAIEAAFRSGEDRDFEALEAALGLDPASLAARGAPEPELLDAAHQATRATALHAAAARGKLGLTVRLLEAGASPTARALDGSTPDGWARAFGHEACAEAVAEAARVLEADDELVQTAVATAHYQASVDSEEVDIDLIVRLVAWVHNAGGERRGEAAGRDEHLRNASLGAILVFLPGWDEILRTREALEEACRRGYVGPPAGAGASNGPGRRGDGSGWPASRTPLSNLSVRPLHSQVSPQETRAAFERAPRGHRKVVLSTNVAETSVTIEDVTAVIDAGRAKEKGFDSLAGVSTLQTRWIAASSARQRAGRAGRTAPGACFHLFTRAREKSLARTSLPEMQRTGLEELALGVKLLETVENPLPLAAFLAKTPDPPNPRAVLGAAANLAELGALDDDERLTPLGRHLAALPLPPTAGRLAILAAALGPAITEAALTVAAGSGAREPWIIGGGGGGPSPASAARRRASDDAGGASDHLALLVAFSEWDRARAQNRGREHCARSGLSAPAMQTLAGVRQQILRDVRSRGLVASHVGQQDGGRGSRPGGARGADALALRGLLVAAAYPQVARLLPDGEARQPTCVTRSGQKARVGAQSVASKPANVPRAVLQGAVVVSDEVVRSERSLQLRTCTVAPPHATLLVARDIRFTRVAERDVAVPELTGRELSKAETAAARGEGERPDAVRRRAVREALEAEAGTAVLVVDGWLRYRVPIEHVPALRALRAAFRASFAALLRLGGPAASRDPAHRAALDAASRFLALGWPASAGPDGEHGWPARQAATGGHLAARRGGYAAGGGGYQAVGHRATFAPAYPTAEGGRAHEPPPRTGARPHNRGGRGGGGFTGRPGGAGRGGSGRGRGRGSHD